MVSTPLEEVVLASSGMWTKSGAHRSVFSIVLYTCKGFEPEDAIQFIERFFATESDTVHLSL